MPLVVLLFMSMLPLHEDRPDRQKAMFYNALRIYKKYIKILELKQIIPIFYFSTKYNASDNLRLTLYTVCNELVLLL